MTVPFAVVVYHCAAVFTEEGFSFSNKGTTIYFQGQEKRVFHSRTLRVYKVLKISYKESGMFPNRQMLRLIKSANSEENQSGPLIRTSKGF